MDIICIEGPTKVIIISCISSEGIYHIILKSLVLIHKFVS